MQYRKTLKPLKQIGSELSVDAVIEGSALQVGDRVRITAQLVDAGTESQLWANSYDRGIQDTLSLHKEVARSIVHEVGATLTAADKTRLANTQAANPQAMEAYLRGLYYFNRGESRKAIDQAREATRLAPQLAPAHELLGIALEQAADNGGLWLKLGPEVRTSLQRASDIEPDRGRTSSGLGWSFMVVEHDWDRAEPRRSAVTN